MIKIGFDKRLELIFGLQYSVFRDYNIHYILSYMNNEKYCTEFYNLYKKHCSKELIDYIRNGGLDTFNRTLEIVLSIDNEYNVVKNEYTLQRKKNNKNFDSDRLSKLLKDFVQSANFEEFYNAHIRYYKKVIDLFELALNKYIHFDEKIITDFYGYKMGEFEIKIYNFSRVGFGNQFGNKIIYVASMMPTEDKRRIQFSDLQISNLFHEFSHPYCNPLGMKFFQNEEMLSFFEESKENGLELCYNNPIATINEYVVRAIQIYLTSNYIDEERTKKSIETQKRKGYNHIEELIELLRLKTNYENFESFYKSEIVPFFNSINYKKTL